MSARADLAVLDGKLQAAMEAVEAAVSTKKPDELPELAGWLGRLEATLLVRLMAARPRAEAEEAEDELLTAEELAPKMKRSVAWVYEHLDELPFRIPLPGGETRRGWVFSRRGFQKYLKNRRVGS